MDTILEKLIVAITAVGIIIGNQSTIITEVQPTIIQQSETKIFQQVNWSELGEYKYTPTHRQLVWRFVLEWCESRGYNEALNPKDKDGTPSHSNFQFKWETTRYYGDRYKLIPNNLEKEDYINWSYDYNLMSEIMNRMIGERNKINWRQEFPECVKKNGIPPND